MKENELSAETRAELGTLLSAAFRPLEDAYRTRAWRTIAPAFRVVASVGREPVGQISAFELATTPSRRLLAIGDLAVVEPLRRTGIARSLCGQLVAACRERGAQDILTGTCAVRTVFAELGLEPVTTFTYYWLTPEACHRHHAWMAWRRDAAGEPLLLHHWDV